MAATFRSANKTTPRWRLRLDDGLREVVPSEVVDGPQARYFRARQIMALLNLMPLVMVGNVINTLALCWTFWPRVPHAILGGWAAVSMVSLMLPGLLWRPLLGKGSRPLADPWVMHLVTAQVVFFAVVWSVVPVVLYPYATQSNELLVSTLVVGTICVGAFLLSPHVIAAAAYVLTLSLTSGLALARSPYSGNTVLFLLLGAYGFTMASVAFTNGRVFMSRLRAEAETERQKQLIDLLLRDFEEHASDWLWEISPTGHLRHVSNRLAQSFGLPAKHLLQRSFTELLGTMLPSHDHDAQAALAQLTTHLRMGQSFRDLEMPVSIGPEIKWWSLTAKPLFDDRGRSAGWRGVGSDVTSSRRTRDELARLANFDALTTLPNRHRFSAELTRHTAQGTVARACSLFFLDLDNFKHINDSLGHAVGDQLLKRVGARLNTCVAEGDLLARLGGDEFALLSWQHALPDQAAALAGRLLAVLSEPCQLDDVLVEVRASVGVALCPLDGDDPQSLLQCADLALYAAKAAGRNTYRFFDAAMAEHARARVRLQQELGRALAAEQFTLHFQPQISLSTGEVIGFEALVRWQHSERGLIGPGEFIPVAEETGQIVPLGTWVLREACRAARHWPDHLRVAVNLSAVQFRSASVIDLVDEALAESGLAAERLEVEITESALIEDRDGAQATLMALRSRGVRVALDDFGTGYSSLAYLRRFPMDKLKIDGMFVRSLGTDEGAQAVVTAIISLARALKLDTTAEGIETEEQRVMLKALGCDDVQGFLMARPMAGQDVSAYLARMQMAEV